MRLTRSPQHRETVSSGQLVPFRLHLSSNDRPCSHYLPELIVIYERKTAAAAGLIYSCYLMSILFYMFCDFFSFF